MKLSVLILIFAAFAIACSETQAQTPAPAKTPKLSGRINHGGIQRTYALHIPKLYAGKRSYPLVIALHGLGGSGGGIRQSLKLDDAADKMGFIIAYPDGVGASWADGGGVTPADRAGVDDVGFISALIDSLVSSLKIDPRRVHIVGFSNGGMLAYRLACELSDGVAAAASVMGAMTGGMPSGCRLQRAVSLMHVHGMADLIVPWEGGEARIAGVEGWRTYSIPSGVEMWGRLLGCSSAAIAIYEIAGRNVINQTYGRCSGGAEVALYGIVGWGHAFPGAVRKIPLPVPSFNLALEIGLEEAILRFFNRHRQANTN
ncbi:MAG: alpha/beta hydrolase family esterase [Deltaproteobacteria bacterium]